MTQTIRIGLVGAGANTRSKHIPGFQAIPGVELAGVCNRRPESTAAVARQFGIQRTFDRWEDLVNDAGIDAVVIGTWPYLHCPITLAALGAGKHVLTEARMAMNAAEARQMLVSLKSATGRVGQVVPSPYTLRGDAFVKKLLADGYIGQFREAHVVSMNNHFGGPEAPLHWRQDATLSGLNMLQLGIMNEALSRWVAPAVRIMAQATAFVPERLDAESGTRRPVGTPDSVHVLAALADGSRAIYQLSSVTPAGGGLSITLRGSAGVIHYDMIANTVLGATTGDSKSGVSTLSEFKIPEDLAGGWRVEADFIDSIRNGAPVKHTSFADGLAYMEFTESVAHSIRDGIAVNVRSTADG